MARPTVRHKGYSHQHPFIHPFFDKRHQLAGNSVVVFTIPRDRKEQTKKDIAEQKRWPTKAWCVRRANKTPEKRKQRLAGDRETRAVFQKIYSISLWVKGLKTYSRPALLHLTCHVTWPDGVTRIHPSKAWNTAKVSSVRYDHWLSKGTRCVST